MIKQWFEFKTWLEYQSRNDVLCPAIYWVCLNKMKEFDSYQDWISLEQAGY